MFLFSFCFSDSLFFHFLLSVSRLVYSQRLEKGSAGDLASGGVSEQAVSKQFLAKEK